MSANQLASASSPSAPVDNGKQKTKKQRPLDDDEEPLVTDKSQEVCRPPLSSYSKTSELIWKTYFSGRVQDIHAILRGLRRDEIVSLSQDSSNRHTVDVRPRFPLRFLAV
jgi:hypothetical protein